MKYIYFLLFCLFANTYTMDNPIDDPGDQEMTDRPTTGSSSNNSKISRSHTTVSTASLPSSKSLSRVATLLESMNSNTGSIISSHHILPGLQKSTAMEVTEDQAKLFEEDVESVIKYHVENKTLTKEMGDFHKTMIHIQIKMIMSVLIGVNHGIINDIYGSKGIHQFLGIEYDDVSMISKKESGGAFHPPQLKNSYRDTVINPLKKEVKQSKSTLCYWVIGGVVANALITAASFTALYLK